MTREIKFRAWDKKTKNMYQDVPLITLSSHVKEKDETLNKSLASFQNDSVGFVLMQYTGLKDKHGIEIYEGDIGRSVDEVLWEVKYDTVLARFIGLYDGNVIEDLSEVHDSMEIIGNIYENPELLNTK